MAEDLILIISIVAALGIGLGGGLLFASVFGSANKRTKALEEEVDKLKTEQAQYKDQVSQHFQKTASLFQNMTEQYRNLYSHLAEGAETLCSDTAAPPALDLPEQPRPSKLPENIPEVEASNDETPPETPQQPVQPTTAETEASIEPQEQDHMLGDVPNIPDVSEPEDSEKPKIH